MPRKATLLFVCLLAVDASAIEPTPNPIALKACAAQRKPAEPVDAWVNRGLAEMMAYGPWPKLLDVACKGTEPVKCPQGPGLLRTVARGSCKLADAWEWGAVMGQPLEEASGGWRLRAEPTGNTAADWMVTEGKRLRELLGNRPARVITTACSSAPDPARYGCLLAELPRAITLDEALAVQSKSAPQTLRIEDAWPAGKPEQGLFRGSVPTSCKALASLVEPDATAYQAAVAAAKKSGFSPDIAQALRAIANVQPDERRELMNAAARDYGFTGECWPRATK